jgi:hypothetical protein
MSESKKQHLGRSIYDQRSRTGRNRSVVDDIAVLTAGGAVWAAGAAPENLPSLEETALALVRDGSFVLVNPGTPSWYFLENTTVPLPGLIYEYQPDDNGMVCLSLLGSSDMADASRPYTKQMRVFTRQGEQWSAWLADGKRLALLTQREQRTLVDTPDALAQKLGLRPDEAVGALSATECYAHPGGLGLLYHAQWILDRIEQIADDVEDTLSKVNRLPLIGGDIGPVDEARGAINSAMHAIVFPGEFKVDRMISPAVIQALQLDDESRREDFYDALNMLPKDSANRPVAKDREMRSQVMLQYVDNLHRALSKVYNDWGVRLSFRRLVVESPDDLLKRKTLLDSCQNVLPPAEYTNQVLALFGLQNA